MRLMPADDTNPRTLTNRIVCAAGILVLGPIFFILNVLFFVVTSLFVDSSNAPPLKLPVVRKSPPPRNNELSGRAEESSTPSTQSILEPGSPKGSQHVSFSDSTSGTASRPPNKTRWSTPAKLFSLDRSALGRRLSFSGSASPTPTAYSQSPPRFFPELSRVGSAESMTSSENAYAPTIASSQTAISQPRRPTTLAIKIPSIFRAKSRKTPVEGHARSASDPSALTGIQHCHPPSVQHPSMLRRNTDSPSLPSSRRNSEESEFGVQARRTSTSSMPRQAASTPTGTRRQSAPEERSVSPRRSSPSSPRPAPRRAPSSPSPHRRQPGEMQHAMRRAPTSPSPSRGSARRSSGELPSVAGRYAGERGRAAVQGETLTTTFVNPFRMKPRRAKTTSVVPSASEHNKLLSQPLDPKHPPPAPAPESSSKERPKTGRSLSTFLHIPLPSRAPKGLSAMRRTKTCTSAIVPPAPVPRTQPYGPPYYARMPGEAVRQGSRPHAQLRRDSVRSSIGTADTRRRGSSPGPVRDGNALGLSIRDSIEEEKPARRSARGRPMGDESAASHER